MAGHQITVEKTILALLEGKKYQTLKDILITMNPADIAAIFEELDEEHMPLLFRLLPKETAAETFAELEPEWQEILIRAFSDTELREVINELYVDDAADLVAKEADEDAIIIFGTSVKENMENEVRVNVIATGFEDDLDKVKIPGKGLDGDKKEETNNVELEETVEEIKSETGYDPKNDFPIPDFLKNMGTGSLNL